MEIFERVEAITMEYVIARAKINYARKLISGKRKFLRRNDRFRGTHSGERVLVLGNGPSLKLVDFGLLEGEILIAVNRSVYSEFYVQLLPKYHLIVDPKIVSGQWSTSLIEDIFEKNPKVSLFLNADWYDHPKLAKWRDDESVFWLCSRPLSLFGRPRYRGDLTKQFTSYYVLEQAISLALYTGAAKVGCLGYEGNGIARLLLGQDSHLHGVDPDFENLSPELAAHAMNFNARYLREVRKFADSVSDSGALVSNLTGTGIMTMFTSEQLDHFLEPSAQEPARYGHQATSRVSNHF